MELATLIAIFAIGIIASFIGGLTSGGGGLISLPFLIFVGLPPQVAIATDRFGSFGYVISSLFKFFRSKKIVFTYQYGIALLIGELIGGCAGAHIAVKKGDKIVRIVFIVIALISAIKLLFFR